LHDKLLLNEFRDTGKRTADETNTT